MGRITNGFLFLVVLSSACISCNPNQSSEAFKIHLKEGSLHQATPSLHIENDLYRVSFTTRERKIHKFGPLDYCIRSWVLKENNQDQVKTCMDGSALRPMCSEINILRDGKKEKVLQLYYGPDKNFEQHYTFYRDQPFIRIDYVRYPTEWFNTVDIGMPGGIQERFEAKTLVWGEENWIRSKVYHEGAFWSIHLDKNKKIYHESDEGKSAPILYKDHFIMLVGDPLTGVGYGRIMPIWMPNSGGIRILKLLWDLGFETFPGSGDQEVEELKVFTGYIFLYCKGANKAFEEARKIIDTF